MTNEEFDQAMNELGLSNSEAAIEYNNLTGAKTRSDYFSDMRLSNGRRKVSHAPVLFIKFMRERYECEALKETVNEMRAVIDSTND